jgi:hypothetical protein
MLLAIQKSYELLANYGFFAREICDKCGNVLGAVRFTRHGESKVYCSRECRGTDQRSATFTPGRPRKYKTDRERRAANHDSSKPIDRILTWKKLSVFNQKQRTCRRKKCLSRTWVLRDLENRSFRAGERKWRSLPNFGLW